MSKDHPLKKKTPTGVRTNEVTDERWAVFLRYVANGATRGEACQAAQLSNETIKAYLITEPTAMEDLRKSQRAWYRRDWPDDRIEELLTHVAGGATMTDAAERMELMDGELDQFRQLVVHDEAISGLYDEARKLQAESWADEMVDIADDATNDTYETTDRSGNTIQKTDHEVVNRSKLRIGTRQWLMARMHHERFGDRIQQDISGDLNVNHADMLDLARKRKETAQKQREEIRERATREDHPQHSVH